MELLCRDGAAELDIADSRERRNGCDERPRRKERRRLRSRDRSSASAREAEPASLPAVAAPAGELAELPTSPSDRDAEASHDCHGVFARGVTTTLATAGDKRADRDCVKRERPPSFKTMMTHEGSKGTEAARSQVHTTGRPSCRQQRHVCVLSMLLRKSYPTRDSKFHRQQSAPTMAERPSRRSAQLKQPSKRRGQQAGAASRVQPAAVSRSSR